MNADDADLKKHKGKRKKRAFPAKTRRRKGKQLSNTKSPEKQRAQTPRPDFDRARNSACAIGSLATLDSRNAKMSPYLRAGYGQMRLRTDAGCAKNNAGVETGVMVMPLDGELDDKFRTRYRRQCGRCCW